MVLANLNKSGNIYNFINFHYSRMRPKSRVRDDQSPFKRYCQYEGFQSLDNSREFPDHNCGFETQVIMFPPPRELRSKTAFAHRGLAFKNIGDIVEMKPRLGQRNVYSRQNIQIMNKKIKHLKESMFASTNIQFKHSEKAVPTDMKLTGFSSLFTSFTMGTKTKRNIYSCANLRAHHNPESPKTSEPEPAQPKTRIKKSVKSTKQLKNVEQNKQVSVRPNNFRATLKQKHVDDNPKILANIIRKKVECMKTSQVHEYIHSLMRRSRD